jgi:hypothetical protein
MKGMSPMTKTTKVEVPAYALEALARCVLPEIQRFFESDEGKREFEQWQSEREQLAA